MTRLTSHKGLTLLELLAGLLLSGIIITLLATVLIQVQSARRDIDALNNLNNEAVLITRTLELGLRDQERIPIDKVVDVRVEFEGDEASDWSTTLEIDIETRDSENAIEIVTRTVEFTSEIDEDGTILSRVFIDDNLEWDGKNRVAFHHPPDIGLHYFEAHASKQIFLIEVTIEDLNTGNLHPFVVVYTYIPSSQSENNDVE